MDSLPSIPEPAPPPDEPREEHLLTVAEQVAAIDTLIGLARERICVFDLDLSRGGWGSEARADALSHFLHRYHIEQSRATLAIDMPQAARPLVTRFEEIWATGEPGLTATVLGL